MDNNGRTDSGIAMQEYDNTMERRTRRSWKRIEKWDILKAFLIFCVVLGHIADQYTDYFVEMRGMYLFIYTFHMPLFIFISGMFAKKSINRNRTFKIIGYLVLYLVLKAGYFAHGALFYNNYELHLLSEKSVPWFMMTLAIFMGLTMLIKRVSPGYVLAVSILLACVAGYETAIGDYLALSRVIVFYPFYYLGYILNRETIERLCRNPFLKIAAVLVIAATALTVIWRCEEIYWLRPLITGRNSFFELEYFALRGWLIRLIYYPVTLLICAAVVIITPERTPFGLLARLGQQTLGVFFFHPFVLSLVISIWGFRYPLLRMPPFFGIWNTVILALIITLVLSVPVFTMLVTRVLNVPLRPVIRRNS